MNNLIKKSIGEQKDILLIIVFFIIILVVVGYFGFKENTRWQDYKKKYNCEKTGIIEGDVFTGIGTNGGVFLGGTSRKEVYKCNNGMTITR